MKVSIVVILATLHLCYAPPVDPKKKDEKEEPSVVDGLEDYMEYHRYLREIVNALESDPDFRQKLEKANEEDIRSGKIAHELEFVGHNVRTRLDEIKRTELERLKRLMQQQQQLQNNEISEDPSHHHLDHRNPHTFEIEDLKKLIAKTTQDLAEADKMRRDEFKEYKMRKEFEKQQKLNTSDTEEKEKLEKLYKEQEEKHKKHVPLHEPGHKKQLEEVWEEQDQMQQEFDPKTFFMLHDLDSNGLWDENEVKALFVKELDKMYAAGAPEDDMRERVEEMERMRETVFQEVDINRDGFIDYNEFLAQTRRNNFEQDHGWQALDEQKPFTDEELAQYIRMQQAQQHGYRGVNPVPGPPGAYQSHPGNDYPQQQYQYQQPPSPIPPGGYNPHLQQQSGYYNGAQHPNQAGYHLQDGRQQAHQPNNNINREVPQLNTNEVYQQKHQQPPQQQYVNQVQQNLNGNQNIPVKHQNLPTQNQNVAGQNPNVPVENHQDASPPVIQNKDVVPVQNQLNNLPEVHLA